MHDPRHQALPADWSSWWNQGAEPPRALSFTTQTRLPAVMPPAKVSTPAPGTPVRFVTTQTRLPAVVAPLSERAMTAQTPNPFLGAANTSTPPVPGMAAPAHAPAVEQSPLGLEGLLARAARAPVEELVELSRQLLTRPVDPFRTSLVLRLCNGSLGVEAAAALLHVDQDALAALFRAFPGPLLHDAFEHDAKPRRAEQVSVLAAVVQKLGPGACSLAVAALGEHPHRAARHLAVLLSEDATAPGVVFRVGRRLADPEPRVAYAAAAALANHLRARDGRKAEAQRLVQHLTRYLVNGEPWQKVAAVRAASILHEEIFVGPLVALAQADGAMADLAAEAQHALRAITCQDLARPRQWQAWWEDWGGKPVTAWLVEALDGGNDELARAAVRRLEELTGHRTGHASMATRQERRAVQQQWVDHLRGVRKSA